MSKLPPLNALRAFEASARLGSFTKAADELNVTQAAISQQVKILEHHLRTELFVREAKGIRLTEAGQSYQPVISQSFHTLRLGTEELFGERGKNTLSIRVSNSFAEHFSPAFGKLFTRLPTISSALIHLTMDSRGSFSSCRYRNLQRLWRLGWPTC